MKHLKMLGLAAIAALGLLAFVGAGSASAFTEAHCAEGAVKVACTLDAHSVESAKFTTTAGTITCTTTEGKASIATAASVKEIKTTSIKYSGCTFLGFPVTVNTGTCQYNFTISGNVHIFSSDPKVPTCEITFEAAGCKVTVTGPQPAPLTSATYGNAGTSPTKDVTITPNITNIVYHQSANCIGGAWTNHTGGTYTGGKMTVTGTNSKGTQIDFTVV